MPHWTTIVTSSSLEAGQGELAGHSEGRQEEGAERGGGLCRVEE